MLLPYRRTISAVVLLSICTPLTAQLYAGTETNSSSKSKNQAQAAAEVVNTSKASRPVRSSTTSQMARSYTAPQMVPSSTPAPAPRGSEKAIERLGVERAPVSAAKSVTLSPVAPQNVGQSKAMMIVGGAGLIAGLIIGGDAGTVVAVAGAAVGLFGLYNYLK